MKKGTYIKIRAGQAWKRRRVRLGTWPARVKAWTAAWYAFLTAAGLCDVAVQALALAG